jgi:2-keto-3-deoxy-L-rhamnonate aldolase RhmA
MSDMVATIIDANGPAPLVRVSWNSIENIKRALDVCCRTPG